MFIESEFQLPAPCIDANSQEILTSEVFDVAVLITNVVGQASRDEVIAIVHEALNALQVIVATRDADPCAETWRRLVAQKLNEAAGGIATKQSALRPAQYLGALRVIDGKAGGGGIRHIDAVLIHGHGLFLVLGGIGLTDAANTV